MSASLSMKQYQREQQTLKEEIEKKAAKPTQQLYEERETRVRDLIQLKRPDRIPFLVRVNPGLYTGMLNSAAYYDPIGYKRAIRKFTMDLEPDMCDAGLPTSGAALEALDVKNRLWPGGPLPPDYEYQFIEREFMKEDEYDLILNDPSDYILRYLLPRMYGAMEPLSKLPPIGNLIQGVEAITPMFASPEFIKLAKTLAKAGRETKKFSMTIGDTYQDLMELGFPPFASAGGGVGGVPFDFVSSFLRGMKGTIVDMYRQPQKLLQLCDLILERRIAAAKSADPAKRGNQKRIGMPLWRGDKSFMSAQHFDKFYWPGLKKALHTNIDLGYVPVPFFEAEFGDRLEHLLDLPKGKMIASIEYVDAIRAKNILKDHTCILVRTPHSAKLWSVRELEEFIKDLIDRCGKGGGLMVFVRIPNKGTTEEFQNLMANLREYGRY